MATKSCFYTEDTVSLKQDPSIIAVVESTWRDIDSGGFSRPSDWIVHSDVTILAAKKCLRDSQPPTGHVTIRFTPPDLGCALVKEEDLILIDRALTIGDVVKRLPTDAQSGMVLKASETCLIEPIYNNLPFTGSTIWPHKPEDNRLRVPAEELAAVEFEDGDRVIHRDWIGEIVEVIQEVTIRLGNGSIVRVDDPDRLMVPDYVEKKHDAGVPSKLGSILRASRERRDQITSNSKHHLTPAMHFWPGQTVFTTKANLRLGLWKVGAYTPSEYPKGVVVDARVISIHVDWIATKLFDTQRASLGPPDETVEWPELEEVRLYNSHNLTSQNGQTSNEVGTRFMNDIGAGDTVRFRDISGAAVKYSPDSLEASRSGIFRRIPRTVTDGFDMNVFMIKETTTSVRVQWQDGTITTELAPDLLPYLNVDDHDVWPGEIVSQKSAEVLQDDTAIGLKKVGVVQTVDAQERTAQIRWFSNPSVSVFKERTSILYSGAKLGPLSDQYSSLALYDIVAYQALSKRRGDLVVLAPNVPSMDRQTAVDAQELSQNGTAPLIPEIPHEDLISDPQNILSSTEVRWFGEIVDLTLDGEIIVRLGALDKVVDIRVPVQRVIVAIGGDDPDGFDSDGDDDDMSYGSIDEDDDEWDSDLDDDEEDDEENIVEETFYEGGERIDNGDDEDAWMTDGSDAEETISAIPIEPRPITNGISTTSISESQANANHGSGSHQSSPSVSEQVQSEQHTIRTDSLPAANTILTPSDTVSRFGLMAYSSMPPSFEILDNAPESHHWLSSTVSLASTFLRQIRREHAILASSLPEGIWVRTWSDRLDLVQVLILGPQGTPYALAPFLFDFHFRADYPQSAPQAYFHSWTNGVGRINPNLYEDGKVCLSILGTWHKNEEAEGWNKDKSSLLQVLVSLLGLVLVEQPYYNEAGFDALVRAEETVVPARIYAEKALCLSKGFIAHALTRGCGSMSQVIEWIYRDPAGPKLIKQVVEEMHEVLARKKDRDGIGIGTGTGTGAIELPEGKKALSTGGEALFRRFLPGLQRIAEDVQ